MDIEVICKHYQSIFRNPKDVLDFVEHDLKHMGLEQEAINLYLKKAREFLGVNHGIDTIL